MKQEAGLKATWAAAILCLAAGVVMTVHTLKTAPDLIKRLERKAADVERLCHLEQANAGFEEAVAALNRLPTGRPAPIRDLLAEHLPDVQADIRHNDVPSPASGWTVRRVDLTINDVALKDLGQFLYKAETQRPPWLLAECTLTAAAGQAGLGRAALVFEAVEKTQP